MWAYWETLAEAKHIIPSICDFMTIIGAIMIRGTQKRSI